MLSPRMQPSAWVLKSRLGQLAGARAHQEASARARRELSFGRTRRGRAANETLPSKKELESCPPPYLTSEGQIKEKARKYAASAYLPQGSSKQMSAALFAAYLTLGANKRNPA